MASPCELLIATQDYTIARAMLAIASKEAKRIEQKYSRFIDGNPLWQINNAQGAVTPIDAETLQLLRFSQQCYLLSDGDFDISAGPLMRLWHFDAGAKVPADVDIMLAKEQVNFAAVTFDEKQITMPAQMNLDFGGIGKEYAVDRVAYLLAEKWPSISVLVNFGGDISCLVPKVGEPWQIGIENPEALDNAAALLSVHQGALATSGDTRRFIEVNGRRYGHIINPSTGYPVLDAPRSVTVLGPNCVTAGMLATMAMLQGKDAELFLQQQSVNFKIFR
jgi:thiamine biosynthesis lipoprotein